MMPDAHTDSYFCAECRESIDSPPTEDDAMLCESCAEGCDSAPRDYKDVYR